MSLHTKNHLFAASFAKLDPSEREITLPNSVTLQGYAIVDAEASYDLGRYTLSLSAVNLTERKVFDTYQYFSFPIAVPVQSCSGYGMLTTHF